MHNNFRFDIRKLNGWPSRIRDWMNKHHFPPKMMFFLLGIVSTLWFLVRVIPKPSRAGYPCMKVAAPFISDFILYLITVGGIAALLHKTKHGLYKVRFISTVFLLFTVFLGFASSGDRSDNQLAPDEPVRMGPDDGPNQPLGKGTGINPGRVVWVWDQNATNENCINSFDMYKPENTNQAIVSRMVEDAVKKLTGKNSLNKSWDALFRSFNHRKHNTARGYKDGEKIFIKINQGTANGKLRKNEIENGFYIPASMIRQTGLKE